MGEIRGIRGMGEIGDEGNTGHRGEGDMNQGLIRCMKAVRAALPRSILPRQLSLVGSTIFPSNQTPRTPNQNL